MFSKNGTFELQLLFMKLDFLLILCNYCLSIFFVQRWIESGCICPERTSSTCMASASLSPMPKAMLAMGTLSSAHAKIAIIKGTFVKLSLYDRTLLPGVHAKLYDMDYAGRGWCECCAGKR